VLIGTERSGGAVVIYLLCDETSTSFGANGSSNSRVPDDLMQNSANKVICQATA